MEEASISPTLSDLPNEESATEVSSFIGVSRDDNRE
jgi:hypothetical protein